MIKLNELRLSEIAEIEKLSGRPLSSLGDGDTPRGLMLQAIVYVMKRREDPKYKFADAGDFSMEEAMNMIVGDEPDFRETEE